MLDRSVALPKPVFEEPVVFAFKDKLPADVLSEPVVRTSKAFKPTATLLSPDVNAPNTPIPTPVFELLHQVNLFLLL